MADVTITVDGKKITAPAGTLLIEACKTAGIEIPAFCYYPGLSLQAACRMCVVRIDKMPKLQTACTVPITDGMVVTSESEEVTQARKATIEILLGNHPLDCPVCDAGGQCELQDMTFTYGAAESRYTEGKLHKDEQQWSPVVFFDRPRCILCYRCVRVCGEGMDVWALGIQNRGVSSVIAPNAQDHLECEECGMCIDICPVGALTSGAYRYKTRPWEMNHVGTICTHCGDGCKTTLGNRRSTSGMEIVRGDNRDKSGVNGDFLCIKGRYAFDFTENPSRITKPMIRKGGKLVPASWEQAFDHVASRLKTIRETQGGQAIGVIGSNRTTNEENYLLQKFARTVLNTNNIDHHRTADYAAFASALKGTTGKTASIKDASTAKAVLVIGNNPTDQHPLLAWNIRTNIRLNGGRLYVINSQEIKMKRQARLFANVESESDFIDFLAGKRDPIDNTWTALRDALSAEPELLIAFGSVLRGPQVQQLVEWGLQHPNAKFMCLGDYANSRGAGDMGLYPDFLPGYTPVGAAAFAEEYGNIPPAPGMNITQMFAAAKDGKLGALYIIGANPMDDYHVDPIALQNTFVVVQDMFLTETAALAEVVLPAASAYEKSGTFTNTYGDLQMLRKAGDVTGVRSDFEMIVRIADRMGADIRKLVPFGKALRADMGQTRGAQMGEADRHAVWMATKNLEPKLSPFDPAAMLDEIQRVVPGYANISRIQLLGGSDTRTDAVGVGEGSLNTDPNTIVPSDDILFTSGTLGRYSNVLNSVIERGRREPASTEIMAD